MVSLYGQYLKEREDFEIVENETGYATYRVMAEEVYIRDIYVSPSHRKEGIAKWLADQVANIGRSKGCKYMAGTVCPDAKGSTESLKVLLAYGMSLRSIRDNLIIFVKEL